MIVGAIIAVMMSLAIPSTQRYLTDQTANDMAFAVASAFNLARVEAMRTGRNHLVFFAIGGAGDVAGNALLDTSGDPAAVLILDDGPTGSPDQNCQIDAGEPIRTIAPVDELSWGYTLAGTTKAPGDVSPRPSASGSSFRTPAATAATWVLFRPDGTPVAVDTACASGPLGSGNGGIYFTNGTRDQAVVLGPLGIARVHVWDRANARWTL